MLKGFKVKILPNEIQKKMLFRNFGVSRWAYNWALNRENENYKQGNKFLSDCDLRKELTKLKQTDENYKWLYEVNNNITKQAIKDCCKSFKTFFQKKTKYPKFKSKKFSKDSFYNDTYKICFNETQVKIENIGWIDLSEYNRIPFKDTKYYNPKVSFDGLDFYISVNCEIPNIINTKVKTEATGIDLGIKTLMVCSNGLINKKPNIKKDKQKLKRLQRKASKIYLKKEKVKSNNLIKLETKILKQHKRITNILNNNIHQFTTKLIKLNPSAIVIEDLNVIGMMKNKNLSEKIKESKFYEIRRQLTYKSDWNGIKLVLADRFFPSSKLCSCCGKIKKDLKLSDRIYKCDCGNSIDRDFQASINLKNLALN